MSWRLLAIALGAVALLAVGLDGLYHLARSRTTQLFGTLVTRVDTSERVVALTFDDGPTVAVADEILSTLGSRHVRATFFVNGAHVAEAPQVARRLVAAGHELANHTYSHERMVLRSQAFIRSQVERTDDVPYKRRRRGRSRMPEPAAIVSTSPMEATASSRAVPLKRGAAPPLTAPGTAGGLDLREGSAPQ